MVEKRVMKVLSGRYRLHQILDQQCQSHWKRKLLPQLGETSRRRPTRKKIHGRREMDGSGANDEFVTVSSYGEVSLDGQRGGECITGLSDSMALTAHWQMTQ